MIFPTDLMDIYIELWTLTSAEILALIIKESASSSVIVTHSDDFH